MAAHSRKLHTFCRAGHSLLQAESLTVGDRHAVAQQVVALLDTRIMPEIKLLDQTHSLEVGASVVKLVVECAVRDEAKVVVGWAVTKICQWLNHEDPQWRGNLEKYFQKVVCLPARLTSYGSPSVTDVGQFMAYSSETLFFDDATCTRPRPKNAYIDCATPIERGEGAFFVQISIPDIVQPAFGQRPSLGQEPRALQPAQLPLTFVSRGLLQASVSMRRLYQGAHCG